jgi:hypothetical protein
MEHNNGIAAEADEQDESSAAYSDLPEQDKDNDKQSDLDVPGGKGLVKEDTDVEDNGHAK